MIETEYNFDGLTEKPIADFNFDGLKKKNAISAVKPLLPYQARPIPKPEETLPSPADLMFPNTKEGSVGDPLTRGAQYGVGQVAQGLTLIPSLERLNPFRALTDKNQLRQLGRGLQSPVITEPGISDDTRTDELNKKYKQASDNIKKWAEVNIVAKPATGKYAKSPENFLDYVDPRRIYQTFGENAPLMGAQIAATIANPAAGTVLMAAIEGGDTKNKMLEYEKVAGKKLDPNYRELIPLVTGSLNAALEKLGLDEILKVPAAKGFKQKLLHGITGALMEGNTEGVQELVQGLSEFGYQGEIPSDLADRLIQSMYGGLILGGGASILGGTAGALQEAGKGKKEQVAASQEIPGTQTGGPITIPPDTQAQIDQENAAIENAKRATKQAAQTPKIELESVAEQRDVIAEQLAGKPLSELPVHEQGELKRKAVAQYKKRLAQTAETLAFERYDGKSLKEVPEAERGKIYADAKEQIRQELLATRTKAVETPEAEIPPPFDTAQAEKELIGRQAKEINESVRPGTPIQLTPEESFWQERLADLEKGLENEIGPVPTEADLGTPPVRPRPESTDLTTRRALQEDWQANGVKVGDLQVDATPRNVFEQISGKDWTPEVEKAFAAWRKAKGSEFELGDAEVFANEYKPAETVPVATPAAEVAPVAPAKTAKEILQERRQKLAEDRLAMQERQQALRAQKLAEAEAKRQELKKKLEESGKFSKVGKLKEKPVAEIPGVSFEKNIRDLGDNQYKANYKNAEVTFTIDPADKSVYLALIDVPENLQGKGIGTEAVKAFIDYAKKQYPDYTISTHAMNAGGEKVSENAGFTKGVGGEYRIEPQQKKISNRNEPVNVTQLNAEIEKISRITDPAEIMRAQQERYVQLEEELRQKYNVDPSAKELPPEAQKAVEADPILKALDERDQQIFAENQVQIAGQKAEGISDFDISKLFGEEPTGKSLIATPAISEKPKTPKPIEIATPESAPTEILHPDVLVAPERQFYDLRPEQVDMEISRMQNADTKLLNDLFGEIGASKFKALERRANSASDPHGADQAYSQMEVMTNRLTPAQREQLYNPEYEKNYSLDDLRNFRRLLGSLDFDSPQALGESLKYAMTKVGTKSSPKEMDAAEQGYFGQIRYALTEAARRGWNPEEILTNAVAKAAERFDSPENAAFMLERFLKKAPSKKPAEAVTPEPALTIEKPAETPIQPERSAPTSKDFTRASAILERTLAEHKGESFEQQQAAARKALEDADVHPTIVKELVEPERARRPEESDLDFDAEIGISDAYDFLRKVESQQYATTRAGRIERTVEPPVELKGKADAIANAGKAFADAKASLLRAKEDITPEIEKLGGKVIVDTETGAMTITLEPGKIKMSDTDLALLRKLREAAREAGAYSLATVGRGHEIAVAPGNVAVPKPLEGTFAEKAREFIRRTRVEKNAADALKRIKENARESLVDYYFAEKVAERTPRALKGMAGDGTPVEIQVRRNRSQIEPDLVVGGRDFPKEIAQFEKEAAARGKAGEPYLLTRPTGKKTFAEALKEGIYATLRDTEANEPSIIREPYEPNYSKRPDANAETDRLAKEAIESLRNNRRRGRVLLANAISAEAREKGTVNLIGKEVRTSDDVAALAQVYRDPRWETLRYIFVKDGKVVFVTGVSSRLPASAPSFPNMTDTEGIAWLRDLMFATEADGYYLLHNHPSGQVKASRGDLYATAGISNAVDGFKGHVIIDSNRYTIISQAGTENGPPRKAIVHNMDSMVLRESEVEKFFGEEKLLKPSIFSPVIGTMLTTPEAVAKIGQKYKAPDGWVTLISHGSSGVRGIMEVESVVMKNPKRAAATIRRFARQTGAGNVFLVSDQAFWDKHKSDLAQAINNGFLRDAVSTRGYSIHEEGLARESSKEFGIAERRGREVREGGLPKAKRGENPQIYTENFKKWFGDWQNDSANASKVVDENGKPLVVYKGMYPYDWTKETKASPGPELDVINRPTEFPTFNAGEPGVRLAGFFGSKETANRFAASFKGGSVFPSYLSLKKPFIIDADGKKASEIQFGVSGRLFRDVIKNNDYDGVIIKNTSDEGNIFVAKKPTQIKSAIGNTGEFNPTNPSITDSQSLLNVSRAAATKSQAPDSKFMQFVKDNLDEADNTNLKAAIDRMNDASRESMESANTLPVSAFLKIERSLVEAGYYISKAIVRATGKATVNKAEWAARMIKEFGEDIRPFIDRIWNRLQAGWEPGKPLPEMVETPVSVKAPLPKAELLDKTDARGSVGSIPILKSYAEPIIKTVESFAPKLASRFRAAIDYWEKREGESRSILTELKRDLRYDLKAFDRLNAMNRTAGDGAWTNMAEWITNPDSRPSDLTPVEQRILDTYSKLVEKGRNDIINAGGAEEVHIPFKRVPSLDLIEAIRQEGGIVWDTMVDTLQKLNPELTREKITHNLRNYQLDKFSQFPTHVSMRGKYTTDFVPVLAADGVSALDAVIRDYSRRAGIIKVFGPEYYKQLKALKEALPASQRGDFQLAIDSYFGARRIENTRNMAGRISRLLSTTVSSALLAKSGLVQIGQAPNVIRISGVGNFVKGLADFARHPERTRTELEAIGAYAPSILEIAFRKGQRIEDLGRLLTHVAGNLTLLKPLMQVTDLAIGASMKRFADGIKERGGKLTNSEKATLKALDFNDGQIKLIDEKGLSGYADSDVLHSAIISRGRKAVTFTGKKGPELTKFQQSPMLSELWKFQGFTIGQLQSVIQQVDTIKNTKGAVRAHAVKDLAILLGTNLAVMAEMTLFIRQMINGNDPDRPEDAKRLWEDLVEAGFLGPLRDISYAFNSGTLPFVAFSVFSDFKDMLVGGGKYRDYEPYERAFMFADRYALKPYHAAYDIGKNIAIAWGLSKGNPTLKTANNAYWNWLKSIDAYEESSRTGYDEVQASMRRMMQIVKDAPPDEPLTVTQARIQSDLSRILKLREINIKAKGKIKNEEKVKRAAADDLRQSLLNRRPLTQYLNEKGVFVINQKPYTREEVIKGLRDQKYFDALVKYDRLVEDLAYSLSRTTLERRQAKRRAEVFRSNPAEYAKTLQRERLK